MKDLLRYIRFQLSRRTPQFLFIRRVCGPLNRRVLRAVDSPFARVRLLVICANRDLKDMDSLLHSFFNMSVHMTFNTDIHHTIYDHEHLNDCCPKKNLQSWDMVLSWHKK